MIQMSPKLIFLIVMCFITGAAFAVAGIYFLSSKFLEKLNSAAPDQTPQAQKRNAFRAKGSGYTSLSLAAITVFWGILLILFAPLAQLFALVYLIFLIAALCIIIFVFK